MKKAISSSLLLIFCGFGIAQEIDRDRMDRDLEVGKSILQTLLGKGENNFMWGSKIEASYLEGYGVIFSLPENSFAFRFSTAPRVRGRTSKRESSVVVYTDSSWEDSTGQESLKQQKEAIITYLADYSSSIGQLGQGDKILVHRTQRDDFSYVEVLAEGTGFSQYGNRSNLSIETTVKNVIDYRSGSISRTQFEERLEISENKATEKDQDLEIFASIIKRLYSPDLSKTFFTNRSLSYERLNGFGVIFHMKTYSSYANDKLYQMPVLARDDVNSEERRETIIGLYPKFERDIKETMVEYGRMLKSLEDDDMLVLKIRLTRCDDCQIPKSIDASVKKSVLMDYDQRKISLDEAMKSVEIMKHMAED